MDKYKIKFRRSHYNKALLKLSNPQYYQYFKNTFVYKENDLDVEVDKTSVKGELLITLKTDLAKIFTSLLRPKKIPIEVRNKPQDHKEWFDLAYNHLKTKDELKLLKISIIEVLQENDLIPFENLKEKFEKKPFSESKTESEFGFVYFVRKKNIYKIGVTQDLLKRLKALKPDEVLNVVRCKNFNQLENKIHKAFDLERFHGSEYFELKPDQIPMIHQMFAEESIQQ